MSKQLHINPAQKLADIIRHIEESDAKSGDYLELEHITLFCNVCWNCGRKYLLTTYMTPRYCNWCTHAPGLTTDELARRLLPITQDNEGARLMYELLKS
jgi:hypothetical protein